MKSFSHPARRPPGTRLFGRRVVLRPLTAADFPEWTEVRVRNDAWLRPWEPTRPLGMIDPTISREAFSARCAARDRDRQNDTSYGFALFVDGQFAGEVNLNGVIRGAQQTGTIGYWIDRRLAGHRYVAEGVVAVLRFAFEEIDLHRVEICIVPRNTNSRRVVDVLGIREEGLAERFLEINGVWEDHVRYGITAEEWQARRADLGTAWLGE